MIDSLHAVTRAVRTGVSDQSDRALMVYRRLVLKNFASFIRKGFPVCRRILGEQIFDSLIAAFVEQHRCQTPYFLEIGAEFIQFLSQRPDLLERLPGFVPELLAWEYVELELDVMDAVIPPPCEQEVDLLSSVPLLSPVCQLFVAQYPVHRLSTEYQPSMPEQPSYLVAYRDRSHRVRFLELNHLSACLFQQVQLERLTGADLADVLEQQTGAATASLVRPVIDQLAKWQKMDIIAGVRRA